MHQNAMRAHECVRVVCVCVRVCISAGECELVKVIVRVDVRTRARMRVCSDALTWVECAQVNHNLRADMNRPTRARASGSLPPAELPLGIPSSPSIGTSRVCHSEPASWQKSEAKRRDESCQDTAPLHGTTCHAMARRGMTQHYELWLDPTIGSSLL